MTPIRALTVLLLGFVLFSTAFAQTAATTVATGTVSTVPATSPSATAVPLSLPADFVVSGSFNQLGSPAFAGNLDMIYTTKTQNGIGMANDTSIDLTPVKILDKATGKPFYSLSTQVNQCLDEKLVATGNFRLYGGLCGGPNFASTVSSISMSLSASGKLAMVYKVKSWLGLALQVRANYISGEGWNPIIMFGPSFNLSKLPAASTK